MNAREEERAVEAVARCLWQVATDTLNGRGEKLPPWDESGNDFLKARYRLAARVAINTTGVILAHRDPPQP